MTGLVRGRILASMTSGLEEEEMFRTIMSV